MWHGGGEGVLASSGPHHVTSPKQTRVGGLAENLEMGDPRIIRARLQQLGTRVQPASIFSSGWFAPAPRFNEYPGFVQKGRRRLMPDPPESNPSHSTETKNPRDMSGPCFTFPVSSPHPLSLPPYFLRLWSLSFFLLGFPFSHTLMYIKCFTTR